jgi:hypothetical protein
MPNSLHHYLAVCAVFVAGICTTVMNWRFSFQLGANEFDAYVWAIFSVALDVCKWTMLPFAALTSRTHRRRAAAAIAIWFVATCYSFASALGFAALNREATSADRRSQTEVHATLQMMRQSPRWQSSAACADATSKASKEFCETYRAMESRQIAQPQHDDPQAALGARLSGLSEERVRLALAFALAVACEIVSALGLFAILQPAATPQPVSPPRAVDQQANAADSKTAISPHLASPQWRPRRS